MRPLCIAVLLSCALAALPAAAGGPRKVDNGNPVLWDTDAPVPYVVDRGELGTLSNPSAEALIRDMFAVWAAVPEASIDFRQAGRLNVDVTGANIDSDAYPPVGSGINTILFDDDGSILEELGQGAENDILGLTRYGAPTGTELSEVSVILNGLCYDGVSTGASPCEITFNELRGVVLHELGHFAGLDHTDLNREFFKDDADFYSGSPTIDCHSALDATKSVCTNNAVIPTMFPFLSEDDSSLVSLHLDDTLALARLYPVAPFPALGATVQGQVLDVDGATPFNGANVILRNLADPYRLAASAVSGDVAADGFFRIEGLPPGNYTLEARPVASIFTGPSSVGQQNGTAATELGAPAEFLSVIETGNGTTDLPSDIRVLKLVAAAEVTSGIDIVLNDITTLTDGMSGAGNDTVGTATAVNAGGAVLPDLVASGDVDFYKIFLPTGWTLRVDVDAKDGGINPVLTVKAAVVLRDTGGNNLSGANSIPDPATGLEGTDDPALEYTAPSGADVVVGIASENDTSFAGDHGDEIPYYLRLTPRAPAVGREMRIVASGGSSSNGGGPPPVVLHASIPTSLGAETDDAPPALVEAVPFLPPDRGTDSDGDGVPDSLDTCPGSADTDSDGICDESDNCPAVQNPLQRDGGNTPGTVAGDRCDAPLVIAVQPFDQKLEVHRDQKIRVEFSEPMDPATLTMLTVRLEDSGGPVTTELTISGDERVVTLAHATATLTASTQHTLIVEATVQDQDPEALGTIFNSTFKTRAGTTESVQTSEISTEYEGHAEQGTKTASRFGKSVATGGDVNGDGVRDLLVGAPRADEGATSDVGEVTLWFGDKTAVGQGTGTLLVFQGDVSGERAGTSIGFVTDITGDGIDEILIGAPGADPEAAGTTGAAYLIFGDPDMDTVTGPVILSTIDDPSCVRPCGVILAGTSGADLAGQAVSAAGDFDGDGVMDLIVGAPGADPLGRAGAGITYLIYGGPAVQAKGLVHLADVGTPGVLPGIRFIGEFADDRSGSALSDWADRRFDGRSDILIGSPGVDVRNVLDTATFTDAGAVFALMGRDRASYAATVDLADVARVPATAPGIVFLGIEQDGRVGFSVWGRGDVTGDGEKDILIGAPGMTFQAMLDAGKAFLVPSLADEDDPIKGADSTQTDISPTNLGTATGSPLLRQLGSGSASYTDDLSGMSWGGGGAGYAAGYAVASSGDLDGDGTQEILIGAPGTDVTTIEEALLTSAGRVYVVFGERSRTPGEVALAGVGLTEPGVVIDGTVTLGRLGEALSGVGDLDDSGTAEVVLGAPGDETSPPNEGTVYITVPIVATETRDVLMGKSPDPTLEWAPTPGAAEIAGPGRYAIYRGDLSDLVLDGGVRTAGTCIVIPFLAEVGDVDLDGRPDFIDTTDPGPGVVFWYLVAGVSPYGVGPIGDAEGLTRVNDETSCP